MFHKFSTRIQYHLAERDGTLLCQTPFGDAASSFVLPPKLPTANGNPPKSWQGSGLFGLWKVVNVGGPRKFRRGLAAGMSLRTGVVANCAHAS